MSQRIKVTDKETQAILKKKYRFVITDETRLRNIVSIKLAWWKTMLAMFVAIVVFGAIGAFLIAITPLRTIMPGYLQRSQRRAYIETALRLDSISNEVSVRNGYIDNILNILNDNIDTVSVAIEPVNRNLNRAISVDSIITVSETEREFVKQYEQSEKFNLSVLSALAAQGFTFINPLQGAEARFPEEGEDERQVTFDMPRIQPVSSIYRGTVFDVYNTLDDGFTIIIQHPNDFVSRYSGLTEAMVKRGDKVLPGSRIGMIERDKAEKFATPTSLELWYNGTAVNPRNYIPF